MSDLNSGPDLLTFSSLRLTLFGPGPAALQLGEATGFTVDHEGKAYLVTNWHVFSGRNPFDGRLLNEKTAATPATVAVDLHDRHLAGRWKRARFPLYDPSGAQLWIDHPGGVRHRGAVDVAAIQIDRPSEAMWRHFPLGLANSDARVTVAGTVHIIGFPVGEAVGENFPIWLSGHVASDPIFDYDRKPVLLVDARTREGMSGSPVIIRTDQIHGPGGRLMTLTSSEQTKFLGIYSGRVHVDADIGYVWRPHVLTEVLSGQLIARDPGRFNHLQPGDDCPISDVES